MRIAPTSAVALAALSFATHVHASQQQVDEAKTAVQDKAGVAATAEVKAETMAEKPAGDGKGLEAAKSAPAAMPEPTLIAKVDLTAQRMTILVNGQAAHTWPISSGRQGYATPVGSFTPGWKAKMWYSKQYDDAPMPHSVFFKNGAAIHATQAVGMLGRPASHGCVRLAPANAATFYGLVGKHGLSQTRVVVFGSPKFAPEIARRPQPSPFAQAHGPRPAQPRAVYTTVQPRAVPGYAVTSGGFNNGGSWFGSGGYAYPQPQVRYVQPGGYYGQGVRYVPRGYRAY